MTIWERMSECREGQKGQPVPSALIALSLDLLSGTCRFLDRASRVVSSPQMSCPALCPHVCVTCAICNKRAAKAGNQERESMELQLGRARAWPPLQVQDGQEWSMGHTRKGWESRVGSDWRRESLEGSYSSLQDAEKLDPDLLRCMGRGREAMGTNWDMGNSS